VVRSARFLLVLLLASSVAGCGGSSTTTADELQACVKKRLPPGAVDRFFTSTEQGVTTLNYFRRGSETVATVFESTDAAKAAMEAEARIGDAHDQRRGNVLYGGGGAAERAIVACLS
jgi:hypothetical protein